MINLQFLYTVEEFAQKFLSAEDSVINTCLDKDGDIFLYYIDRWNNVYNCYVNTKDVLEALTKEHKSLQDDSYEYKLVYSYVELCSPQYNYQNVVFIRIEKRYKGVFGYVYN